MPANPCLTCGACCAHYRASFYWAECDDATEGGVPVALTEESPPLRRVMRGTGQVPPRCVALQGTIGRAVSCAIYEQRASVCRDYVPSFRDGAPEERCDQARAAWNLPPLTLEDWLEKGNEKEGPKDRDPFKDRPLRRVA